MCYHNTNLLSVIYSYVRPLWMANLGFKVPAHQNDMLIKTLHPFTHLLTTINIHILIHLYSAILCSQNYIAVAYIFGFINSLQTLNYTCNLSGACIHDRSGNVREERHNVFV